MNKKRIILIAIAVLLGLAIVGAGGFVWWANDAAQPTSEAITAMQSDELVQFSRLNDWLVFQPTSQSDMLHPPPSIGFILYPGGKVDYRAYAPIAREIASRGYLVIVPPMPLNLAFFGSDAASAIIDAFPNTKKWAVGGHSVGGVAASSFASSHPDEIGGIAFWASYPAGDMRTFPGEVVSIYGTNDGLASPVEIQASKKNLPSSTVYVPIKGGDHAQFGAYGPQSGDNPAMISPARQRRQLADATAAMLSRLQE